jgi:integrase
MLRSGSWKKIKRGDPSARTIRHAHAVLHNVLQHAVRTRKIKFNPASDVELPTVTPKEPVTLTAAQTRTFLTAVKDHRFGSLFAVALGYGLRIGELIALRWGDTDPVHETIIVRHSMTRSWSGKEMLAPPKTGKGLRVIPLPPGTFTRLFPELGESQAFVWNLDGKPLTARIVSRDLEKILKANGLPRMGMHGLRHTCFTILAHQQGGVLVVRDLAGHASAALTSGTYVHGDSEGMRQALATLDAAIARTSTVRLPAPHQLSA